MSEKPLETGVGMTVSRMCMETSPPFLLRCLAVYQALHVQDKHNASNFLNISWKELPLSGCKYTYFFCISNDFYQEI